MKNISYIIDNYLNSDCERIIIPCFDYEPSRFLDMLSTICNRKGKTIKTRKFIAFDCKTNKTEVLFELSITGEPKRDFVNTKSKELNDKIVSLRKEGKSLQEISEIVGKSRACVSSRLRRYK